MQESFYLRDKFRNISIFNFTWEIIRWKSKNWLRLSKFGTFNRYYWIWYSMRVFSKLFFWYGGPHADEKEWSNEKYFSGQSIETFQRGYVAVPRQSSLLTIAASKSRWRRFCGPGNAHGKMVMRSQQKLLLLRRFYCRGYDSSGAVYTPTSRCKCQR